MPATPDRLEQGGPLAGAYRYSLNETGQQQATALSQRLKNWPIDTIYTSDLQRCVQTAVPLATELGLEPIKAPSSASATWATLVA
ncbi:MAG: histidine phosphatase family protein [Chloroflexota bacterium]